jgi:uncharacterized protein
MNRLGTATSPYLLQHKDNPVAWWPWGQEAFAQARQTDRPVLLSIGYAACHWCHVMAHESFEDPATAALMNELFVNIKVDREERPDIDQVYMSALHALGEQGGWPLTVILTPDGQPFFGGTYFPPVARYGRPDFRTVLAHISHIWREDRDRIHRTASALSEAVSRAPQPPATPGDLGEAELDAIARQLAGAIDPVNGGLRGAPKFPNPPLLEFLIRAAERSADSALFKPVSLTLERLARGGIHDQLAGGFARYAVDECWLVPHFEKMLYDNAQLLELYAWAWQKNRQPLFADAAAGIVAWLASEMTTPDGAFAASLDADSDGEEGRFYVWTEAEIVDVLGADDAALFARVYDVTPGGNWEGRTILNRLDTPDPDTQVLSHLAVLRQKLLARRASRVRPGLDDKILADWNGLTIAALVRAGLTFTKPDWITLAARAFAAIEAHLLVKGVLGHSWRAGRRLAQGFALDHAALARAALALHEATRQPRYLDVACALAQSLLQDYRLDSGILAMSVAQPDGPLPLRPQSTHDDAIPNANGLAAEVFWRLAVLSGEARWHQAAEDLLGSLMPHAAASPLSHAGVLNALDFRLRAAQIVLIGPDREAFRRIAWNHPAATRILMDVATTAELPPHHPIRAAGLTQEETAAFLCQAQSCSWPLRTPADLRRALAQSLPESKN